MCVSVTWVVGVGDGGADGVCLQGEGGRRRHSWTEKQETRETVGNIQTPSDQSKLLVLSFIRCSQLIRFLICKGSSPSAPKVLPPSVVPDHVQ